MVIGHHQIMTERIPIECVRGVEEVTVWLWPNTSDPVTVRFTPHEWAKIERKAERVADGDVEKAIGELLQDDLSDYL